MVPIFKVKIFPFAYISQGKTEKQALKNIKEALELHVHTLAEDGLPLNGNKNAREKLVSVVL